MAPRGFFHRNPFFFRAPGGEQIAALAGSKTRPEFYPRHCSRCPRLCLERCHSAAWERALPASAVAGSALMPRTCGQQVAPTVLSETLFALSTTLSRMTPQRDLAAGTARHPFLSRKGCKSDPRGAPLGYPLDEARCFPGSMGGPFRGGMTRSRPSQNHRPRVTRIDHCQRPSVTPSSGSWPRDVPKNRRLPPKPPTLLRRARRALSLV